jgi:DNA invertase Pin-like site-specific DNA recombinase
MVYGYIRVSTDKQTMENQRYEINRFWKAEKLKIEKWIEEKISGTKAPEKRQLGGLLKLVNEGDIIICSELSRLGRSFFMIMSILSGCMERGIKIWTIKDN